MPTPERGPVDREGTPWLRAGSLPRPRSRLPGRPRTLPLPAPAPAALSTPRASRRRGPRGCEVRCSIGGALRGPRGGPPYGKLPPFAIACYSTSALKGGRRAPITSRPESAEARRTLPGTGSAGSEVGLAATDLSRSVPREVARRGSDPCPHDGRDAPPGDERAKFDRSTASEISFLHRDHRTGSRAVGLAEPSCRVDESRVVSGFSVHRPMARWGRSRTVALGTNRSVLGEVVRRT